MPETPKHGNEAENEAEEAENTTETTEEDEAAKTNETASTPQGPRPKLIKQPTSLGSNEKGIRDAMRRAARRLIGGKKE